MRRTRSTTKQSLAEDTDEDVPPKKMCKKMSQNNTKTKARTKVTKADKNDFSSSESDLDEYLTRPEEIDLNSSFFQPETKITVSSLKKNKTDSLSNINTLSDSDSEPEHTHTNINNDDNKESLSHETPSTSQTKINFHQLHEYTEKLEEVKKVVEKYKAKKALKENNVDVKNLLALGEAKMNLSTDLNLADYHSSDFESLSESEKEDWEEIKTNETQEKSIIPAKDVQITVQLPTNMKQKKGVDLMAAMKRRLNRIKKETQVFVHKVHLLCWIAHGNYVNSVLNSEKILALALSLLPSENCYPSGRTDIKYLEQILRWYKNMIKSNTTMESSNLTLDKLLMLQINKNMVINTKMLVLIFVSILRSLGIQCRLVLSLQVEPLKPPSSELCSLSNKNTEKKMSKEKKKTDHEKIDDSKNTNANKKSHKTTTKNTNEKKLKNKESKSTEKMSSKSNKSSNEKPSVSKQKLKSVPQLDGADDDTDEPSSSSNSRKPNLSKLKQKEALPNCKRRSERIKRSENKDSGDEFQQKSKINGSPEKNKKDASPKTPSQKITDKIDKSPRKINLSKLRSSKSNDELKRTSTPGKVNLNKLKSNKPKSPAQLDVRNDIINIIKGSIKQQKQVKVMKMDRNRTAKKYYSDDDDSDYAPEPIEKKKHDSDDEFIAKIRPKVKRRVQVKPEESPDSKKTKNGNDFWVEVFLEAEEKWISVDVIKGKVHCVQELYNRATHPVSYILAWDNNSYIKDVSKRYCPNWNTVTHKLRVDQEWWDKTLKPFAGPKTARDREEDEDLARQQLDQPLPKTISEYKDHPLYVLKRHLLKFQALYPPDAPPLGFVRNEPVYSRDCVYTLHSREIWLKHAKVVKPKETPYKIVKARPKYDRLTNSVVSDLPLEIFGPWQVDDYVPPTAENGIVPRNAYGNVELFKKCMLPKGTVHLQLPGLNKVAKKLNIDCAPAVVGFDFHSGWSHPTFDGFVVCEEYAETLQAAWHEEQEEAEKREQEKIEKRVYGNWKRLIKGLLIRERLKTKYNFTTPEEDLKRKKKNGPKLIAKKQRMCSDSESD